MGVGVGYSSGTVVVAALAVALAVVVVGGGGGGRVSAWWEWGASFPLPLAALEQLEDQQASKSVTVRNSHGCKGTAVVT